MVNEQITKYLLKKIYKFTDEEADFVSSVIGFDSNIVKSFKDEKNKQKKQLDNLKEVLKVNEAKNVDVPVVISPLIVVDMGIIKIYPNCVKWADNCYNPDGSLKEDAVNMLKSSAHIEDAYENPPQNIAVLGLDITHLTNSFNKMSIQIKYNFDARDNSTFIDRVLSAIINDRGRLITITYGDSNSDQYFTEPFMITTFTTSHKYGYTSYTINLVTSSAYLDETSTDSNSKCIHIPALNNLPLISALRLLLHCGLKRNSALKSLNNIYFYFPNEENTYPNNNFESWSNVLNIDNVLVSRKTSPYNIKPAWKKLWTIQPDVKESDCQVYCTGLEKTFKNNNHYYNWWYTGDGDSSVRNIDKDNEDEQEYLNTDNFDDNLCPAIKADIATEPVVSGTRGKIIHDTDINHYQTHKKVKEYPALAGYNKFLTEKFATSNDVYRYDRIYTSYITNIDGINTGYNTNNDGLPICNLVYIDDYCGYDPSEKHFYPVLLQTENSDIPEGYQNYTIFSYDFGKFSVFPYNSGHIYYEPGLYYITNSWEYHLLVPASLYEVYNTDIYNYNPTDSTIIGNEDNLVTTVFNIPTRKAATRGDIIKLIDDTTSEYSDFSDSGIYSKVCQESAKHNIFNNNTITFKKVQEKGYRRPINSSNLEVSKFVRGSSKYLTEYDLDTVGDHDDNGYYQYAFKSADVAVLYEYEVFCTDENITINDDKSLSFVDRNGNKKRYFIPEYLSFSFRDNRNPNSTITVTEDPESSTLEFENLGDLLTIDSIKVKKVYEMKREDCGFLKCTKIKENTYSILVSYYCGNDYCKLSPKKCSTIFNIKDIAFVLETEFYNGDSGTFINKYNYRSTYSDHTKYEGLQYGINHITFGGDERYLIIHDTGIIIVNGPEIVEDLYDYYFKIHYKYFINKTALGYSLLNRENNDEYIQKLMMEAGGYNILELTTAKFDQDFYKNDIIQTDKNNNPLYNTISVYDKNLYSFNKRLSDKLPLIMLESLAQSTDKKYKKDTELWNKYFSINNTKYNLLQQKSITIESMDIQPMKLIDLLKERISDYTGGIYYYKWQTNSEVGSADKIDNIDNLIFYRVEVPETVENTTDSASMLKYTTEYSSDLIHWNNLQKYEHLTENSPTFIIGTEDSNVKSYNISDYSSFLYTTNDPFYFENDENGVRIVKTKKSNGTLVDFNIADDTAVNERAEVWSKAMSQNGLISITLTTPLRFDLTLGQYIKVLFYLGNDKSPSWQSGYYIITKVSTKIGSTNETSISAQKLYGLLKV